MFAPLTNCHEALPHDPWYSRVDADHPVQIWALPPPALCLWQLMTM